ncbi:MAG: hypothetical protein QGI68_01455 [Pseudomonadales bacterium]|jgi:hypothetical protein|nr:hypothetical protein [Pseudomonadales bacterium]MDP7360684.1 hypothetical protein [Pseudomonadales bacterium]MDP7594221.1 hypothetical protein [Pseudomonadales bacterium]HJN52924.1 hypothetical protein [Pseudomonadales bacterium]|tara:strand:- start:1546 stop:2100 length:555 start_codon:yes stop_codon:yes gene_type:complete
MDKEAGRILKAAVVAIAAAALILITLILPAEFDFDPLGTGQALGILGLSGSAPKTVSQQDTNYQEDAIQFILQPYESVEYKYRLKKDSSLIFSWKASGAVTFELHGEPDGGPEGFAESFSIGKRDYGNGTFTAPFSGIHGWFWENRGTDAVTIDLTTAGFYSAALKFRDGFVDEKSLDNSTQAN